MPMFYLVINDIQFELSDANATWLGERGCIIVNRQGDYELNPQHLFTMAEIVYLVCDIGV